MRSFARERLLLCSLARLLERRGSAVEWVAWEVLSCFAPNVGRTAIIETTVEWEITLL